MKRSFRSPAEAERHAFCPDAPRLRTGEGNRRSLSGLPPGPSEAVTGGRRWDEEAKRVFRVSGKRHDADFGPPRPSSNLIIKRPEGNFRTLFA